jgi:hypothetical protein
MLSMGAMWFGISLPLVYIGYYFGYRKQPYEQPVRTNQVPVLFISISAIKSSAKFVSCKHKISSRN